MRQKRLSLLLLLAVLSGLIAGYLALSYLRNQPAKLVAAEPPRGKVVVAVRDLPLGTLLRAEDVRTIDWPAHAVPAGYIAAVGEVVGRGLLTPVRENEPVLTTKLASREAGGGLAVTIPDGMRGISVRVDEVIGVAGFVVPGTRVDVLLTIDPNASGQDQAVTRVILQNVETLAAGQSIQHDPEGKPQTVTVITLLVSPEDAERLALAANQGRIQLALRNRLDLAPVQTPGIRTSALVAPPRQQAAAPTRAVRVQQRGVPREGEATIVEMYRGGVRTLSTFAPGTQ